MRQHDRNHHTSVEPEDSIWTVLPIALIVVLSVGVLTMGVLRSFTFGPSVGDVIVFQPSQTPLTNDAMQRSDVTATLVGEPDRKSCALNLPTMVNEGGSLLVEQTFSTGRPMMQVHWAGHHTSKGRNNCGASADLLIQPNDLLDLAGAAGGFGFSHKIAITTQVGGTVPAMLD